MVFQILDLVKHNNNPALSNQNKSSAGWPLNMRFLLHVLSMSLGLKIVPSVMMSLMRLSVRPVVYLTISVSLSTKIKKS